MTNFNHVTSSTLRAVLESPAPATMNAALISAVSQTWQEWEADLFDRVVEQSAMDIRAEAIEAIEDACFDPQATHMALIKFWSN